VVVGRLKPIGSGIYIISLSTTLIGNYNVEVIASDNVSIGTANNSQYLITARSSFYLSPFVTPVDVTARGYIQDALDKLTGNMNKYCASSTTCTLDKTTSKNITTAISLIQSSIGYFQTDGNHLITNKGLTFFSNITAAVIDIYLYVCNNNFGPDVLQAIEYLYDGGYKIDVTARNDALTYSQAKNFKQQMEEVNEEICNAILRNKRGFFISSFNHLTNAWKFSENIMGANLKKEVNGNNVISNIPEEFALGQNYPNPFNPSTKIEYQLPAKGNVTLRIYDILGRLVTTLVDKVQDPGYYSVTWDASKYASGIYIYAIQGGSFTSTKKLILLK
jgi:hypothetical protein